MRLQKIKVFPFEQRIVMCSDVLPFSSSFLWIGGRAADRPFFLVGIGLSSLWSRSRRGKRIVARGLHFFFFFLFFFFSFFPDRLIIRPFPAIAEIAVWALDLLPEIGGVDVFFLFFFLCDSYCQFSSVMALDTRVVPERRAPRTFFDGS